MSKNIFDDLFVLELANNHLGNVKRGLKIIAEHSHMVRTNNVRAAIKLQFRDVDNFIHKDFQTSQTIRYINKTSKTKLSKEQYSVLIKAILDAGCMPMATPFDEKSVDWCVDFDLPIIKIASSDINDWPLIETIAHTKKPVIVSTGGTSLKDIDDIVIYFNKYKIPLAINHCVSLYPCEDSDLELNQIDFLKHRYPGHTIGLSSHEYHDWSSSIMLAFAKGARTFERHIDIDYENKIISPYCSLPSQIDFWFKAYLKAKEMCGNTGFEKRIATPTEVSYLDGLVRGIYAKKDLPAGYKLSQHTLTEDIYAAIPLQKGQISCREIQAGEILLNDIKKDSPIMIDSIECEYTHDAKLKKLIYDRGL